MAIFARTDPQSASVYLSQMPEGASKDHAISAFRRAVAPDDPEAGLAWAATISNANLGEESLAVIRGRLEP